MESVHTGRGARQGWGQDSEQRQRTHLARCVRKTPPAGRGPWPRSLPHLSPRLWTTLLLYSSSHKPPSPLPWGREAWHLFSMSSLGCLANNPALCCGPGRLSGLSCCERAKQTRLGNTTPAPAWTDLEDTLLSELSATRRQSMWFCYRRESCREEGWCRLHNTMNAPNSSDPPA